MRSRFDRAAACKHKQRPHLGAPAYTHAAVQYNSFDSCFEARFFIDVRPTPDADMRVMKAVYSAIPA